MRGSPFFVFEGGMLQKIHNVEHFITRGMKKIYLDFLVNCSGYAAEKSVSGFISSKISGLNEIVCHVCGALIIWVW